MLTSGCGSDLTGKDVETLDRANTEALQETPAGTGEAAPCPAPCTPAVCRSVEPSNPLITDWRDVGPDGLFVDNDSFSDPNPNWWEAFFGGPYAYPAADRCSGANPSYPLTQSVLGVWNVRGTVGTWSGFGLWLAPCMVDMSAYQGVSFAIWGDVGSTGTVTLHVNTSQHTEPSECQINVGTCEPDAGECRSPAAVVTVPATRGAPTVLFWSDFSGGTPVSGVDPSQIVGLHWSFDRVEWGDTVTPPYSVDVSIGEIALVP
jgi:hypothetical protein